jgi:hypothetical protein
MNEPQQTHETPQTVGLGGSDLFGEVSRLKKELANEKADHADTQAKWNEALDTGLKVVKQRDALVGLHIAAKDLHLAIAVMLKDWRDGDFELPRLAQIHISCIEEKYRIVGLALKAEDEAWEKFQREVISSPNQ